MASDQLATAAELKVHLRAAYKDIALPDVLGDFSMSARVARPQQLVVADKEDQVEAAAAQRELLYPAFNAEDQVERLPPR